MAKDPKLEIEPEENLETTEELKQPRSYRMHILVILIGVVLAQATLLFFLLPSPSQVRGQLNDLNTADLIGNTDYEVPPNVLPSGEKTKEEYVEKSLGDKFQVQNMRPGPDQTIDTFTVNVVVLVFKKDETAYDKLFEKHNFAIREAVENVLKSSTMEERNQVSLRTIKQRIMKAINDVIREPYIRGVICNDAKIDMI